MIRVDRNRITPPEIFRPGGPAEKELDLAREFFSQTAMMIRQQRFDFKIYRQRQVQESLTELFYGKCAYYESKIGISAPIDPVSWKLASAQHLRWFNTSKYSRNWWTIKIVENN